jgi:hypothetical protein
VTPAAIVAVSVVGSALVYGGIERPARHVPLARMSLTLAGVVAVIGILGFAEQRTMPLRGRMAEAYRAFDLPRDIPRRWREHRCFLNALDEGTHAPECVDAPRAGKDELVVLWGDSFAAQLYPGMRRLEEKGASVRIGQFTQAACPPLVGARNFRPLCTAINDRVLAEIARLRPATVVLAGDWVDVSMAMPELPERLRATLAALREAGVANVLLVGVFPKWPWPVPRAMVGAMREGDGVTMPQRLQPIRTEPVQRELDSIAAGTQATSFHPGAILCDSSGCLTTIKAADGEPRLVFFDAAHLTEDGSEYVAARMLRRP